MQSVYSTSSSRLHCHIVASEFELKLLSSIHFLSNAFGEKYESPYFPRLLSFYKDDFGIKEPSKVDMPLKKEIKLTEFLLLKKKFIY